MQTIIVYVDDAEYAQPLLQAMAAAPQAGPAHWVVVACAPRITHRVSKWVSNRARENWRNKWAQKLFDGMLPGLQTAQRQVTPVLARGPLSELLETLEAEHGRSQVVDLRRPKQEEAKAPVAAPAQPGKRGGWKLSGTLAGMGAMLGLLLEEALI